MALVRDMATRQRGETAAKRRVGAAFSGQSAILVFLSTMLFSAPTHAQAPSNDLSYTRHPNFRIPFQTDQQAARLKQVHLYVSTDQGKSWHPADSVGPERQHFDFQAKNDGIYWFSVRTVDMDGRAYPLTMETARPGLKVCVDTQPPTVALRPLLSRDGQVGVEWEIRDENLDPSSVHLDYRLPGSADWLPLRYDTPAAGQHFWRPATNGALEVQLRARDKAENIGSAKITLNGTGQDQRPGDNRTLADSVSPRVFGLPAPGDPSVRLVNSKRISLNYELKEVGPSGVSNVELWYTKDGRNWQKYGDDTEHKPPFVFNVHDEGVYGFTLVVRSGVGLGGRPPQVGETPQVWVEVDLTKPIVRLLGADVSRDPENKTMTIQWSASDKNLGKQPITISFAEQADGPWTPIAGKVENTGKYVWQMPASVPYKLLIRVEAIDRAGNIGVAETPTPVIVDLAQPKGVIVDVAPANK